ncbi:MAG TPA: hypothetical protein VI756_03915 [Blastocatellia bacterium]
MAFEPKFPPASSPVELRLLKEYGAVFLTHAIPPPKIIFDDEEDVVAFQKTLQARRSSIGEFEIELQSIAMDALEAASRLAKEKGISISARSEDSGGRSYQQTLSLWSRNVERGLQHWIGAGRMTGERAQSVRLLATPEQIAAVLEMEESENLFFSTYCDKSILQSVAAPGASQHLALLAFDLAEYQDEAAEAILSEHGWHRTVLSDLPHFTYIGCKQDELPRLGLRLVVRKYDSAMYRFWIPDIQ